MSDIPIYLVSMAGDSSRREQMSQAFPDSYPGMILTDAVDGRQLPAQKYFQYISSAMENHNRILSPAEVGCSLSHLKVLEQFLEGGAERAIILEDDVIGNDQGIQRSVEKVQGIPEDAVIILGGQEGMPSRKYIFGKPAGASDVFKLPSYSHHHVFRTCCYGVTRYSATQIVASQKRSLKLADAWPILARGGDFTLYFSRDLAHPIDRNNSHIEQGRATINAEKNKGFKAFWLKRMSRLKRRAGASWCRLSGHRKILF
ncbi:glycosyltransferase family 25 protein [Marinobacter apostichopi]|uniref:glycosyltransferase family 25 protein n=1 Tax=Marinobacter apostichopi TaxID=3035454 RepID=UPI002573980F|nr:glycosyltransferase family 25 protein [Marinobacter sp. LA51]